MGHGELHALKTEDLQVSKLLPKVWHWIKLPIDHPDGVLWFS